MFASLLVANRGEIACRIFKTARAMGLRCLAVHSEADAKAKHVREADASWPIGPAAASESYLSGDRILEAAQALGADAIHPGYGFLSENPAFAQAVIDAGLIWVGPSPAAIRAMGLKDEAKRIAEEAGAPVLPGYREADQSERRLLRAAKQIGFPVLIKAVAGGGGRGIREVRAAEDFKEQLAAAQREAKAAFGDDRVLLERLVERPRHIEVQVFGDKHGGLVHLFERDCSLQRRRQKVIEEAPAPGMTQEVRTALTKAALNVARAVAYDNAGTVEFIADGTGPLRPDGFWFLEVNTRLQVEHPVTEAVTGLDLVEWQLRVAAGERLPQRQEEIAINGCAIEARICAEDPTQGFRPSVGRLGFLPPNPPPGFSARIDSGYESGDVIPSAYDNLLRKVIASGADREDAIERLLDALDAQTAILIRTNQGFVRRCVDSAGFRAGEVHTGFIPDHLTQLLDRSRARDSALALHAAGLAGPEQESDPWALRDGWRLNAAPRRRIRVEMDGEACELDLDSLAPEGGPIHDTYFAEIGGALAITAQGEAFMLFPTGARADLAELEAEDELRSPLPGRVVQVSALPGGAIAKGDALIVIEAMKMEHALKAPRAGIVAEVLTTEGAQVAEGAPLVRLAPLGPAP